MKTNLVILILICIAILLACKNTELEIKTIVDTKMSTTTKNVSYNLDKKSMDGFTISNDNSFKIVNDESSGLKYKFSSKYFDLKIMYADSSIVAIYCIVSGIKNGLILFPIKNNKLFLIDRKSGNKRLCIESKQGLLNATIIDKNLYVECYNPHVNRFITIDR